MVAVSYKQFSVPSKYFERNARRKNGREGQRKDRYTGKEKTREKKMTAAELMHHNFDEIFIELDPVKREAMMRNAYTEDCVWIHPGGRLVGIAAVNDAASEIRKHIPEYRYTVVGDIHTMHANRGCTSGNLYRCASTS